MWIHYYLLAKIKLDQIVYITIGLHLSSPIVIEYSSEFIFIDVLRGYLRINTAVVFYYFYR